MTDPEFGGFPGSVRDPLQQRALSIRQRERCDFEWISKKGLNRNDETHPAHRCGISRGHKAHHRCNCSATRKRRSDES